MKKYGSKKSGTKKSGGKKNSLAKVYGFKK